MDDENWKDAFLEDLCREPVEGTQDEEEDEDSNEIVELTKIKLTRKLMNIWKKYSTFLKPEGIEQKLLK